MSGEYTVEKTVDGIALSRHNVEDVRIRCLEGLCAVQCDEVDAFRDIIWYENNVLNPGIANGNIKDGSNSPFDDRKMRFHSARFVGDTLNVELGYSHFGEFKAQFKLSPDKIAELLEKGKRIFNDEHAYLGGAPGASGVIITADGAAIVGERKVAQEDTTYAGDLQGFAGHLGFIRNPRLVDIEGNALREAEEEMGVRGSDVKDLKFVGLYSNPVVGGGDLDFTFLLETTREADYFTSGAFRRFGKEREHAKIISLPTYDDVRSVLSNGVVPDGRKMNIVFSTRAALDNIRYREMTKTV